MVTGLLSNIESSVSIKQCNKIKKQNNVKVNVFVNKEIQVFPIYASKGKFANVLNLSLVTEGEKKHYVLLNRLPFFRVI